MPSVFSHAVAGFALSRTGAPAAYRWKLSLVAGLSAMVPDLDAIGHMLGVPYDSFFGHRGFTHSIAFAVLWGALIAAMFFRERLVLAWAMITVGTVSHPLLDMCTNGGLGCALFAPFENSRHFFAWRPIKVAPIGVGGFFTRHGLEVFLSEVRWVWLPSVGILLITWILGRRGSRARS